ncbi:hypothetical protein NYR55_12275 [Sphingomonas sp. BGYR3]|uniref:hypothetical protein n=1 Tax=Sphingomonas sp. BGYR3 TaxID=2975483 RepID=UPI0021A407EE|nr:hypothetical protein [Sphingomonas sp. BGYR3]MDG5489392.1 hypothetical protein [Sphingomonas sp. BGYR3]
MSIALRPAPLMRAVHALLALSLLFLAAGTAQARLIVTFWSQDFGSNFPHAFFTIHGTSDDGTIVRENFGFSPRTISPAVLFGPVKGRVDGTDEKYILKSNAHFAVTITDAQHAALRKLAVEWSEAGDPTYRLNSRNCVHFAAEAMRRVGLTVVEEKKLMKKPRSFTQSIALLNTDRITQLNLPAAQYAAWLEAPQPPAPAQAATVTATP